ncbi:hypothetical protein E2C01_075361 [Portunus trituberculatus]|uniref:Uncharacterized protein n=1 Tax=Portunus trituberculatus TaxID=210409 RepID=A0A5B7IFY4_PORTR|nr:hypothetical protein [Portunus trituberculatus]
MLLYRCNHSYERCHHYSHENFAISTRLNTTTTTTTNNNNYNNNNNNNQQKLSPPPPPQPPTTTTTTTANTGTASDIAPICNSGRQPQSTCHHITHTSVRLSLTRCLVLS